MPYNPYQNPYYSYQPYGQQFPNYGSSLQQNNYQRPQPVTTPVQAPQGQAMPRSVNSPDEITPQEVPMSGQVVYFPKNDGTEVYGKFWKQDGTIGTLVYKLQQTDARTSPDDLSSPKVIDEIMARFDSLESKLGLNNRTNTEAASDPKGGLIL